MLCPPARIVGYLKSILGAQTDPSPTNEQILEASKKKLHSSDQFLIKSTRANDKPKNRESRAASS